jgi:hypothetical protein
MPRRNKIYWFEGVTEKGVKSLLNDENSKFTWLRSQRNRRVLVVLMSLGLALIASGSYWTSFKKQLNLDSEMEIILFSIVAIFVLFSVVGGYSFLRISVRGLADAPDELLDERQIQIRNTSFRYAYLVMGYLVLFLMLLVISGPRLELLGADGPDASFLLIAVMFIFASLPSMILAWREKDI